MREQRAFRPDRPGGGALAAAVLLVVLAPQSVRVTRVSAAVAGVIFLATVPPMAGRLAQCFGLRNVAALFDRAMVTPQFATLLGSMPNRDLRHGGRAPLTAQSGPSRHGRLSGRQGRTRAVCSASMRWSTLRVDSPVMLEPMAPSRNSLHALRALRSDRRAEFDDEARCARGPWVLRFSAPHRRAAACPGTPLRDRW
jgi:hypothetical protein